MHTKCLACANACNTPFRLYKHFLHEGGACTPMIASWPAGIAKGREGTFVREFAYLPDFMSTCLQLSGAKYPDNVPPGEGVSILPLLAGKKGPVHVAPIYWEHEGNAGLRWGKWKLVREYKKPWELYDIEADRTELNNLAEKESARMNQMAERWEAWAQEALAKPWPWGAKKIKFSKKKNFTLKQGDHLPQTEAPMVRKRGFTVAATVETKGNDGVIVAQGGTNHGWALHVWKGQLRFVTRHNGKLTSLIVEEPFPKSAVNVYVELDVGGEVILKVNDKTILEGKTPGPMVDMPLDGLEVGEDRNGAVGRYPADKKFEGTVKNLSLKLLK